MPVMRFDHKEECKSMSAIDQLASALVAAQAEFSAIPKTSENPFFRSFYADLATVVGHTAPVLAKHGLAVAQFPTTIDGDLALTTYLLHSSGQFLSDTMKLCASKQDAQGQGAAITYARRFAYMAALGLVADVDDDGNAATKAKQAEAAKPKPVARIESAKSALRAAIKTAGLTREQAAEYSWVATATDADYEKVTGLVEVLGMGKAVG